MKLTSVKLVEIYTTPYQLRMLAKHLEDKMKKTKLGEEVASETIYGKDVNQRVKFIIDQDFYNKEQSK